MPTPLPHHSSAIVCLRIPGVDWIQKTEESVELYAQRHGLDLVNLSARQLDLSVLKWRRRNRNVHLEKFQIFDLLGRYNRLVYVDADVLIHPDAPNIFEGVPATHLGVVNEQLRHEAEKRVEEWELMQRRLGSLGISPTSYFNAGVMVTSARHRPMFDYRRRSFAAGRWPDQNTLNYAAVAMQMPIQWMGWEWNCMPLFPAFHEVESRRKANFIHYAGESAKAALQEDLEYFYGQKVGA